MIVYFLQAENGLIKIGKTGGSVHQRIQQIIYASPLKMVLLGYTDKHSELELHRRFHEHRVRGEWFFPHAELLSFIATVKNTQDFILYVDPPSPESSQLYEPAVDAIPTFVDARNRFEKEYLEKVLARYHGNVTTAAKIAGKFRADFYVLLRKHDIAATDFR